MPNPSSSVIFSRKANAGAAAKPMPVFRVRKGFARSGSAKLGSYEPKHRVKTQLEVPGTEAFQEMFVASRPKLVAMAYSILRNIGLKRTRLLHKMKRLGIAPPADHCQD